MGLWDARTIAAGSHRGDALHNDGRDCPWRGIRVPGVRDRQARRGVRLLAAVMAAGLLCLALVLPTLGAAVGPTKLENPTVTPRSGNTATQVTFSVTYRSALGTAPDYVRAVVGSTTYPMSATASTWKQGVDFQVTTRLPLGTMSVRFEARDIEKFADQTDGGTITIGLAPSPSPTPTPTAPPTPTPTASPTPNASLNPTASPTVNPTALPAVGPTGSPTATPAGPTTRQNPDLGSTIVGSAGTGSGPRRPDGSSSGQAGPGSSGDSVLDATDDANEHEGVGNTQGSGGAITGNGGPTVGNSVGGAIFGSGNGSQSAGSSGTSGANSGQGQSASGKGGPAAAFAPWLGSSFGPGLAALGLDGPGHLATLPAMVIASTAVITWMAFMLFNKKRRDEEAPAPDPVLQAQAAAGMGFAPGAGLARPEELEANMPRWRRPSLLEARRTDPIRTPMAAREPMAFSAEPAGITPAERRPVRYTVAALLDGPDELRSSRISEVAAGDEVQIEGRSGSFCEVVCPDGRRGWIHRTALGEPLDSASRSWASTDFAPPAEAENALAALLAARGLHRSAT